MSAYYAAGATAPVTEQSTPAPVLVAFAGPAPQSRLTVAFRIFMAIPQLIVLWLLGIAAIVITIIGWFGALFTGRLPVFAADFLTGYLRWLSRVYAYNYLLTDVYPPFTLDDADYPVRLAVAPGQLNRLAVLFRIFLLIPCWIVQAVVTYGALTIFMFVTWLIVLVTGQMPDAIHQGLAAVLRYQVRTLGFAVMLTSAYPGGLFGDPPDIAARIRREVEGELGITCSAADRALTPLLARTPWTTPLATASTVPSTMNMITSLRAAADSTSRQDGPSVVPAVGAP